MEIASLILSIVGAASILAYLVRQFISPRIFFRVSGEQAGEPITLKPEGQVSFAIGTTSKRSVVVSKMWIDTEDGVEISGKDGKKGLTTDRCFPVTVVFAAQRIVTQAHLQGVSVRYKATAPAFRLKVGAIAALEETDQGFLVDMFPPRRVKRERTVAFRVDGNARLSLQQSGLAVHPGEALHVDGAQAQDAMWAATEKGTAEVQVRELLDEESSKED